MFARFALATSVLAATVTVAAADGPTRLGGPNLTRGADAPTIVHRPSGDGYLIITQTNE